MERVVEHTQGHEAFERRSGRRFPEGFSLIEILVVNKYNRTADWDNTSGFWQCSSQNAAYQVYGLYRQDCWGRDSDSP